MNPFAALAGQPYLQIAAFLAIVFGGGGSLVGFAAIIAGRRQRQH
jgi:ABC-type uncharacterized transport system permease subunit